MSIMEIQLFITSTVNLGLGNNSCNSSICESKQLKIAKKLDMAKDTMARNFNFDVQRV